MGAFVTQKCVLYRTKSLLVQDAETEVRGCEFQISGQHLMERINPVG